MEIQDVKIRRIYQDSRLRALVSLTIDGEMALHDIKIIEGPERLFVAMPSRKDENGVFRDIVHPIRSETRQHLESVILEAYYAHLAAVEASLELERETEAARERAAAAAAAREQQV